MKRFLSPTLLSLTTLAISGICLLNSCEKENPADTETTTATDNNLCEGEFLRMLPTVNKIAIDDPGVHRLGYGSGNTVQSCPTVSVNTPNQFPLIMTIDYGTGCTDATDGKVRAGRIICEISNGWDSTGTVTTMTLDSFFVNSIHFEGSLTLTRLGSDTWRKVVANGKCSKTGTEPWEILFASDHTITFNAGANNSSQAAIITTTGTNSGTDRKGKTWTSNITSPIIRDMSCSWLTQGTVEITPQSMSTRKVDFGTGTCDNRGTITIDGNSFEFTMN
jgi:hypothetical protein